MTTKSLSDLEREIEEIRARRLAAEAKMPWLRDGRVEDVAAQPEQEVDHKPNDSIFKDNT